MRRFQSAVLAAITRQYATARRRLLPASTGRCLGAGPAARPSDISLPGQLKRTRALALAPVPRARVPGHAAPQRSIRGQRTPGRPASPAAARRADLRQLAAPARPKTRTTRTATAMRLPRHPGQATVYKSVYRTHGKGPEDHSRASDLHFRSGAGFEPATSGL